MATGLHDIVQSGNSKRKGDARYYEPPVICAKRGCHERLTIAAVAGGSKHCCREHAGFGVKPVAKGPAKRVPPAVPLDQSGAQPLEAEA